MEWLNRTSAIHPRSHRILSDASLKSHVSPLEIALGSSIHTLGVPRMTEIFEIVRHDDGQASVVRKPRLSFDAQAQAMFTVGSTWEEQLFWRGELNDDSCILFDFVDEFSGSLIVEEGTEPVLEALVVDLAVFPDLARRFQDHDELGVVGWFVWWTHGV